MENENYTNKVRFNNIVNTILVPAKSEYNEIKDSIWYNPQQISTMKLYMIADLKSYAICSNISPSEKFEEMLNVTETSNEDKDVKRERETLKIAMRKLYQPDEGESLNENIFQKPIESLA